MSIEEKERGGSSRFILLLVAQKGKRSRQRSGALGKRRAGRGGLHFGKLDLGTAKDCRAGGELEMGIGKRADSYKGVMTSVLNRHKKLHVSWVLPLRKAAVIIVNDYEGFNCIDGGVCVFK